MNAEDKDEELRALEKEKLRAEIKQLTRPPWGVFGLKEVIQLVTLGVTGFALALAWNSKFFDEMRERSGKEKALADIQRCRAEIERDDLRKQTIVLKDQRDQLSAEVNRLALEKAQHEEEWKAIEQAAGPDLDFNVLTDSLGVRLSYYAPAKGMIYHLDRYREPNKPPGIARDLPADLATLAGIARLKLIRIRNCRLTTVDLENISKCPNVNDIELEYCDVDGQVLSHLQTMPQLKALNLTENPVSSLEGMAKQPALQTLTLAGTKLVDSDLRRLIDTCPKLATLNVHGCPLTNESVEGFLRLPGLRHLDIRETRIDSVGLMKLAKSGLDLFVNISENQATIEQMTALRQASAGQPIIFHPQFDWKAASPRR